MRHALAALAFAGFTALANAQVTVPFTFAPSTAARAAEVNANFQALATAIDNLAARVSKLEGQITPADIAGVYGWRGLQIGLINGGMVETISYTGTVTLAPNGTFSGTLTGRGFDLPAGGNRVLHNTDDNVSGTWTLSGSNTVTLSLGDDALSFLSAARGQVLVFSNNDNSPDGSLVLLMLVRTSLFN